jgi:hypothetical protein
MDLNYLYSQHQIALMNAASAASVLVRHQLLDSAAGIARHIGNYQEAQGAEAGISWLNASQPRPLPLAECITGGANAL